MATRPLRSNRLIKASSPKRSRRWYSKPIPNLAKSSKTRTRRRQDNQRKRLGFSWISLSESCLFNGLRRPLAIFSFGSVPRVKAAAAMDNGRATRRERQAPQRLRGVDLKGHDGRILAGASIFRKELLEKMESRSCRNSRLTPRAAEQAPRRGATWKRRSAVRC